LAYRRMFYTRLRAAAAPVIGFAAIADLYPADKVARIYALLGMILAAVPAIAPFIGGIISTHFGWPVIFMCILILFVVSFFCTWLILPASLDKTTPTSASEVLKSYKSFLTSKAFLALALLCPIYNSVEWFYLTFLPFYMQDQIGISPEYYGIAIGVLIGWFAIGSYVGGKLITAYGNHNTIVFALTSGLISGLMLWVTVLFFPLSVLAICIPLSLFLLAFGMLFPSSVSSALSVFKENRTRASSIRSLFGTSFAYIGSFSAEWVSETNLAGFALYLSMCSLIAIAVYHMRARAEQVSI
jgi:DHA1 family bicyclomycin/chloramphenicol resistance-like MFS transporter